MAKATLIRKVDHSTLLEKLRRIILKKPHPVHCLMNAMEKPENPSKEYGAFAEKRYE